MVPSHPKQQKTITRPPLDCWYDVLWIKCWFYTRCNRTHTFQNIVLSAHRILSIKMICCCFFWSHGCHFCPALKCLCNPFQTDDFLLTLHLLFPPPQESLPFPHHLTPVFTLQQPVLFYVRRDIQEKLPHLASPTRYTLSGNSPSKTKYTELLSFFTSSQASCFARTCDIPKRPNLV